MNFLSNSINDTKQLANSIAKNVPVGTVIALNGNLGSGKTTFTQGFAESVGITETVISPTFKLISEYLGNKFWLFHIDAYRLKGSQDFMNIGGERYLIPEDGITIIEWANVISPLLPENTIDISFSRIGENPDERQIKIKVFKNDI